MGFTESFARLLLVLLWGSDRMVIGRAQVGLLKLLSCCKTMPRFPAMSISHSEAEASRIFSASGIRLRWVDCSQTPVCHHVPGSE